MKKGRAVLMLLLAMVCLADKALCETDDLYQNIPQKSSLALLSPKQGESVMPGNLVSVDVQGQNLELIEVRIAWADQEMVLTSEETRYQTTVQLPPIAQRITVTARGYAPGGEITPELEAVHTLKPPREELIDLMIAQANADFKTKGKNFLRAEKSADAGMCKNFIMRMFTTYKDAYEMQAFPGVEIFMPLNDSGENCKPYRYGVQWRVEAAEDGNCYETVEAFRYDTEKTKEENRALARAMLEQVQRGDCFQLVGVCEDFNSPHSLLFIEDYDQAEDQLVWTDCNMKGTRIDGERWGWVQYGTTRRVEWMLDTICRARNGATLYRLRADLVKK